MGFLSTVLMTVEAHIEDGRFATLFEVETTKEIRSARKLGISAMCRWC